ncbi:hypothetical protein V6R86_02775 [Sphingomonas kaistensis]|uniref:DNA breaking-rejoining protein n=1 Tax=Sphingomonas kaistensis TaxID=298708 RepID=A0ABZ2FXT3_9SPHN
MMTIRKAAMVALGIAAAAVTTTAVAQIVTTNVVFPRGAVATTLAGTIRGPVTRDYVVRATAGQTMRVRLTGSPNLNFNVLPPGSNDSAIFIGSTEGNSFAGTLSVSGAYKIRVYQMRASARRGEVGNFRLSVAVDGRGRGLGGGMAGGNGLGGLNGMNSIRAIDVMGERGSRNVDSTTLGNTQYGIYYNPRTRVCAQLTMANTRVVDARDIRQHPLCR